MRSSFAVALAEEAVAHDLIVGAARFTRPLRTDYEVAPYAGYGLGFLRWTQSDGAARAVFADLSARDAAHACAHRVREKAAADASAGARAPTRAEIAAAVARCP